LCSPTGWSPFPGNINQLVLKLSTYVEQLDCTGGNINEFVNPKYRDATKTAFKSSTRLECMMQDYPKSLPADAKVGFTVINQVGCAALLGVDQSITKLISHFSPWVKMFSNCPASYLLTRVIHSHFYIISGSFVCSISILL
jgi:hypothetical protein